MQPQLRAQLPDCATARPCDRMCSYDNKLLENVNSGKSVKSAESLKSTERVKSVKAQSRKSADAWIASKLRNDDAIMALPRYAEIAVETSA